MERSAAVPLHIPPRIRTRILLPLGIGVAGLICGMAVVYGAPWLGFLLLAGAVITLSTMRRPYTGMLVVICGLYLLPFGVIPIPLGTLHLTFLDVTLSIALLAWVLRLLARPRQPLALSPVGGPILLFLGIAVSALLFGIGLINGETLRAFLKTVNSILFFFTVINSVHTRRELEGALRTILLAGFGASAIALFLYVLPTDRSFEVLSSLAWLGYPAGDQVLRYIADTPILRATGTAIDPNVLGGMLLLILPLAVAQVFEARPLLSRLVLLPLVAVTVLALLLTYSRSAWLGAFVGILFVAVFCQRKILGLLGALIGALLLAPGGSVFVQRFLSGVFFADRAAQMRLGEYSDAVRLIGQYPFFGVGFGGAPDPGQYVATSSIYLLMAEEMGLVGLGTFLLVMGSLFWTAYVGRRTSAQRGLAGIQIGVLAGVAGALAAGLFDHYFFNLVFPHTIALFWLFVGLAVATIAVPEEEAEAIAGG